MEELISTEKAIQFYSKYVNVIPTNSELQKCASLLKFSKIFKLHTQTINDMYTAE